MLGPEEAGSGRNNVEGVVEAPTLAGVRQKIMDMVNELSSNNVEQESLERSSKSRWEAWMAVFWSA